MRKYILSVSFMLIIYLSSAQEKIQKVEVEGGVTIPIGSLKNTMNIAPNVGLWFRKPINSKNIVALGASLNFPKKKSFEYADADYTSHTNSFSGMLGAKLDKILFESKKGDISLIWSSSFGYGFYFYHDIKAKKEYEQLPEWEKYDKKKNNNKPIFNKPFSTVHVGQGLMFRIKDFGLHARYNYTPYSLFTKRITPDFGAQSLSLGLFYRQ